MERRDATAGDPAAVGSTRPAHPARADARRQAAIVVSAVVMLIASAIGSGAFGGTPIAEAADGALATDATPVAPAVPAFAIWSVIYAGLLAFAVWQAFPRRRTSTRLRRLGPWVIASMLLNGAWILSVQVGWLAVSVALIAALLVVLARIFVLTVRYPPAGRLEALLLDGTMGLYLGWVAVATVANVTAWLASLGVGARTADGGLTGASTVAAVVVLLVAGAVGVALAHDGGGRISVALAMVWGLAWVVVARLTGDLVSAAAALAAATSAGAIAAVTIAARPSREERAEARLEAQRALDAQA